MNRIQSRNNRIRAYKTKKTYSSFFDDKIYILDNGTDMLALSTWS